MKIFWISYQKECTGTINKKKENWISEKNIKIKKKDRLHTKLSWTSYEWVWTATTIKSKNIKTVKIVDCERPFLHQIILKIVSMRIHSSNVKKQKLKFFLKLLFFESSTIHWTNLKIVSMGVNRNDNTKSI